MEQQSIQVVVEKRQVVIQAAMAKRGLKGDQGDPGPEGPEGPQGPQGDQGPQGNLPPPQSATITRTDGYISKITLADLTEINISRDEVSQISSVENGSHQWNLTRDENGQIEQVTVTEL